MNDCDLLAAPLLFTGDAVTVAVELHVGAVVQEKLRFLAGGHLAALGTAIAFGMHFRNGVLRWHRQLIVSVESNIAVNEDGDEQCQ